MPSPHPEFDWMSVLDIARTEESIFRLRMVLLAGFALVCGVAFFLGAIPVTPLAVIMPSLAAGAIASGLTMYHARRRKLMPVHAFVNNTVDVTVISAMLAGTVFLESHHIALLGPAHLAYFVVIIGSATRFHVPSTVYAAALAAVQYTAISTWFLLHPVVVDGSPAVDGMLRPSSIALRVLLMLVTGAITTLFIRRVKGAVGASQENQRLHARVVNEISDGLLVCSEDGRIVEANAAASDLIGVPRSVLVDLEAATVLPDPLWSVLHDRWEKVLAEGAATAEGIRIQRDRAPACFVDVDARAVRVRQDNLVRIVLRDVTAEQSLWEKDSHYKRLASVRKMATALAHEFNNILSSIEASAFVLSEAIPKDSPETEEVKIIRAAVGRATALVREIADLTDTRRPASTPTEVVRVIEKAITAGKPQEEPPVTVQVDVAEGVQNVLGDEAQLVRALGKVIATAYSAMLDGGKLTIAARNVKIDERKGEVAPGDYVVIEVTDTGIGMPADMIERAFDPFVLGENRCWTGFALSGARAVVNRHGGCIALVSSLGKGSTCTITLPATLRAIDPQASTKAAGPVISRSARLLVVDDDPGSRRSLARVLATRGYEIHLAEDGRTALDMCETEKGAFDLVLLDMVMPGLSGKDVLAALRSRFPNIKVLIVTGDADDNVSEDALKLGASGVTHKPFDVLRLFDQVRSLTSAQ